VWNFFSGDEYGTFVTQGDALVSPNEVNRRAKKKLIDAKDQAIAEKNQLAAEITLLEEKKKEIIDQLELLNQEKQALLTRMNELSMENTEMQDQINSLFFLVGTRKELKESHVLKGGFLRSTKLDNVDPTLFKESIDLRMTQQIILFANALDLPHISKVVVFPNFYIENVDYKVTFEEDRQKVTIDILKPDKMKAERVVIAIN
jgi:predicted nuclease with TOPRIM domain